MDQWITDTAPSEKYRLWSRANAGEVYPDPVSPLSSSLAMFTGGEMGWRDAYVDAGAFDYGEFEDFTTNTIGCFGGYMYINMSLTRIYGVRMPGLTPEIVDFTYFGDMPGIPSYESEARPTDESPIHAERLQRYLSERVFGISKFHEVDDDRAMVRRLVDGRPDLAALTDDQLVNQIRGLKPIYRSLFCRHILISGAASIGIGTVAGVLDAIGQPQLSMTLIAGLGDVDSDAPSAAMWELARAADADPAISAAFDAGVAGLLERLRAEPGAAGWLAEFDAFEGRFESRGPNEWELRAQTWGTKPELALALIDRMRHMASGEAPIAANERRTAERETATAAVSEALAGNDEALGMFLAGLQAAHVFNHARERSKTTCILLVHEMRLPIRELGRRLVERGALDTVDQIFMATDDELETLLADPASLTETLRAREARYLELFDYEPPFVFEGSPPPVDEWARKGSRDVDAVAVDDVLTGIPGCAGVVTGTARVILDPGDPGALEPGDILVAPVTDPAWTPLFVPAGGVVVDVGAQVTHAVIVSRELGIPCVVSVTDGTRKIPDGATIEVDGAAGTVRILALP